MSTFVLCLCVGSELGKSSLLHHEVTSFVWEFLHCYNCLSLPFPVLFLDSQSFALGLTHTGHLCYNHCMYLILKLAPHIVYRDSYSYIFFVFFMYLFMHLVTSFFFFFSYGYI